MAENDLPTKAELVWKSMFSGTEEERQAAKQLLNFGLYHDDHEHPSTLDHRLDPSGHGIESSPMGALIKSIVDSQPEEGPGFFEEEMESRNDTPPDREVTKVHVPVEPPDPEPGTLV
jgi:hypothetical protein